MTITIRDTNAPEPIVSVGHGAYTLLVLLALLSSARAAATPGAYTEAQATKGGSVYAQYCAQCHCASLEGEAGPALTGQTFVAVYGTGTAAQLYDFISRQMPLNAPASLTSSKYLDVTALVLARNGMPAGDTPLTAASLGAVQLALRASPPSAAT